MAICPRDRNDMASLIHRQVIILTNPTIRINTKFVIKSIVATKLSNQYLLQKDIKPHCILELDPEGIPIEVWEVIDHILNEGDLPDKIVSTTTLDDVLYVLCKYYIFIDLTEESFTKFLYISEFPKLTSTSNPIYFNFVMNIFIKEYTELQVLLFRGRNNQQNPVDKKIELLSTTIMKTNPDMIKNIFINFRIKV